MDYCDIEWFASETNRDHFGFETTGNLHVRLLVDHEGCSISSKGFLPTIVDIMVIPILLSLHIAS